MKSWIWGAVKIAIAAVLVWYVIGQIETDDRLKIAGADPAAAPEVLTGTISGDWRSDSWVFQPDDGRAAIQGGDPRVRPEPGFFTALRGLNFTLLALVLTGAGNQGDFDKIPALHKIWLVVLALVGGTAVGVGIFMSSRARRLLRIDALLARLPGQAIIAKVDGALTVYRKHPRALLEALLVSFPIQACGILSFWCFARALGAELAFDDAAVVFPVVQTVTALPLAPAGWGLGETLYGFFFARYGAGFTLGVASSVLFRLATQVGWGLVGGGLWAFGRERQNKELS